MPGENSPSYAVLEALGYALYFRDESGALSLAGEPPDWLAQLWPGDALPNGDASPFLENFLIDAHECWDSDAARRSDSGPWIELDPAGNKVQLRATALTAGGRACLVIERLGAAFEASVSVMQQARDNVITLQRLDAEIQKKEILVHCLAENLSAALSNVVTSLRLMELEEPPPKTLQLLDLALRATQEQRALIQKVLDLFGDELGGLYGREDAPCADADLHQVLQLAVENVKPLFDDKGVRLSLPSAGRLCVSVDSGRLVRVVTNMLQDALENSAAGSEVAVRISEEADTALLSVEHPDDGGSPSRLDPSSAPSAEAFLRQHFCRIAVESCHGETGFTPLAGGGTSTWLHLPRSRGAA